MQRRKNGKRSCPTGITTLEDPRRESRVVDSSPLVPKRKARQGEGREFSSSCSMHIPRDTRKLGSTSRRGEREKERGEKVAEAILIIRPSEVHRFLVSKIDPPRGYYLNRRGRMELTLITRHNRPIETLINRRSISVSDEPDGVTTKSIGEANELINTIRERQSSWPLITSNATSVNRHKMAILLLKVIICLFSKEEKPSINSVAPDDAYLQFEQRESAGRSSSSLFVRQRNVRIACRCNRLSAH